MPVVARLPSLFISSLTGYGGTLPLVPVLVVALGSKAVALAAFLLA